MSIVRRDTDTDSGLHHHEDGQKAAAYISASHNPPEYNGIRFRTGDGYGMLYRDAGIVDIYMSGEFRSGNGSVTVENADRAILEYGDYAAEKVKTTRDLRVCSTRATALHAV